MKTITSEETIPAPQKQEHWVFKTCRAIPVYLDNMGEQVENGLKKCGFFKEQDDSAAAPAPRARVSQSRASRKSESDAFSWDAEEPRSEEMGYEYKTVPAPRQLSARSNRSAEAEIRRYGELITKEAQDGWEFHSITSIVVNQPNGFPLFGKKVNVQHNMLIFKREL